MSKPLTLYLEKNGETKTVSFKLSPVSAAKMIRQIKQFMKEKWVLVDVTGGPRQARDYLKNEIQRYNEDPKKYRVSGTETVKQAFKIVRGKRVKEKELVEAMK